jgi:hypothetical protein
VLEDQLFTLLSLEVRFVHVKVSKCEGILRGCRNPSGLKTGIIWIDAACFPISLLPLQAPQKELKGLRASP